MRRSLWIVYGSDLLRDLSDFYEHGDDRGMETLLILDQVQRNPGRESIGEMVGRIDWLIQRYKLDRNRFIDLNLLLGMALGEDSSCLFPPPSRYQHSDLRVSWMSDSTIYLKHYGDVYDTNEDQNTILRDRVKTPNATFFTSSAGGLTLIQMVDLLTREIESVPVDERPNRVIMVQYSGNDFNISKKKNKTNVPREEILRRAKELPALADQVRDIFIFAPTTDAA